MVRIAGVNIPDNKRIEIALTYIFGIGVSASRKILASLEVNPDTRTKDLSTEDANRLREEIEKKYRVEGELRHVVWCGHSEVFTERGYVCLHVSCMGRMWEEFPLSYQVPYP